MNGLPTIVVFRISGDVLVEEELDDRQISVGGRNVQRSCPDAVPALQTASFRHQLL